MKKYEEPKITFSEFRLDKSIADTCWGLDGTRFDGKPGSANYCGPFYYDVKGEGYVSFNLKGVKVVKDKGSCGAPDAFDLVYYGTRTDANGNPLTGDYFEKEVEEALSASAQEGGGGNNGQNYNGLISDFPFTPDPSWSL